MQTHTTISFAADQPAWHTATMHEDFLKQVPRVLSEIHQHVSYISKILLRALYHHSTEPDISKSEHKFSAAIINKQDKSDKPGRI